MGKLLSKIKGLFIKRPVGRTIAEDHAIREETQNLSLYQYPTCPYCHRVRKVIKELNLDIDLRDIHEFPEYRNELITKGGSSTVPCLRIQDSEGGVRWLYESSAINRFLISRFGQEREGPSNS
ncbi:MAG: glutaredoxin family protein [Candidatus Binatia bacterium]